MLAALTPEGSALASRITGRFHLDPADWYHAAEPVPCLPSLARAVIDSHAVFLVYESWKGVRERKVDPLGLVQKGAKWYLVGRVEESLRTYRVGAIRKMDVLDQMFERPANFELATYWSQQLQRFEQELRPEVAQITASNEACRRLADLGGYAAQAVAAAPDDGQGWREICLPFENSDQGARLLLSLGPEVRVEGPADLRKAMRKMAQAVLKNLEDAE